MSELDLNLVRTFVLLYETGSVTVTADALHVTQPTVSYSLRKLRRHFGDELFRRRGQGIAPTAAAQRIYEPLHLALGTIDGVLRQTEEFEPSTMSARFRIALSDIGEATLLPRVVSEARIRAPGVSFVISALDVTSVERELNRGELDAFVATPVLTSHRTIRTPLFRERYVVLVSADHPRLVGESASITQLAAEEYAVVVGPSGHLGPRAALSQHGLLGRVRLEVTRFSQLPYVLTATDLVAIVPTYVASVFAGAHPVRPLRLPFEIEPIEVAVYSRHESSRSPAQRWLIAFLIETLAEQVDPAQLPPYGESTPG